MTWCSFDQNLSCRDICAVTISDVSHWSVSFAVVVFLNETRNENWTSSRIYFPYLKFWQPDVSYYCTLCKIHISIKLHHFPYHMDTYVSWIFLLIEHRNFSYVPCSPEPPLKSPAIWILYPHMHEASEYGGGDFASHI